MFEIAKILAPAAAESMLGYQAMAFYIVSFLGFRLQYHINGPNGPNYRPSGGAAAGADPAGKEGKEGKEGEPAAALGGEAAGPVAAPGAAQGGGEAAGEDGADGDKQTIGTKGGGSLSRVAALRSVAIPIATC